jgi:[ribosomal protein S5]-alanine N-acetyltransferase
MQFFKSAFIKLPALNTQRLLLRRLTLKDSRDMFRYASDPLVSRHVLWDVHETIGTSRDFIRAAKRQYRKGLPATFAIELKDTRRMIGTIGFMWINTDHKSAEVGYSIARDEWNKGYATEALLAILAFGFNVLRLNRIEAQHETDNPASGKVMSHAGMRYEGILRGRLINKGHVVDVALYAILRADFRQGIAMETAE